MWAAAGRRIEVLTTVEVWRFLYKNVSAMALAVAPVHDSLAVNHALSVTASRDHGMFRCNSPFFSAEP